MSDEYDISIVGPGRVGTAIGVLAGRAGLRVAVGARRGDRAEAAAEAIGAGARSSAPAEAAAASGLVLLTVTDTAIEAVCRELAGSFRPSTIVAHCSGALDSGVLAAAAARGCDTGSMHPLQTFPTAEAAVDSFPGTYCFLEGSERAARALGELAKRIGARPVPIRPGAKALYHAGAVMACNYVTSLLDGACSACEAAGIDRATALSALGAIVRATVANVLSMGPAGALTGPISRGQREIVRMHADALDACNGELADLYRAAAAWTVNLALSKGTIDHAQADALRKEITLTRAKE